VDRLVVGVSIKDYVHPKEVSVTPGTGKVRFLEVLSLLKKGGFNRGPLLVECLSKGDSVHLLEQARKTRKFLQEIVQKI
jgi:sugar phosphate isomerase/epimerase